MGAEDPGECSRQERPLKKAKYVWQVKGKYHLKGGTCQKSSHKSAKNDTCQKKHITNFLARTEAFLDSGDEDAASSKNIDQSLSAEIPLTLVSTNQETQEQHLRRWQARQLARGYIDNTINSVLETWVSAPFDDAEDLVENCQSDGHVVDEGILMAIEAHGLKKGPSLAFVKPGEFAENASDQFTDDKETAPAVNSSSSTDGNDVVYPVDILNAAILVAIEKKGLSSCSTNQA